MIAVKTGERRFLELIGRYGREPVLDAIAEIMDRSAASARARTRTIPDGVYEAESFMDDDGVEVGKKVPIGVRVEVKGDEMTIDLTKVARQVRGFYNSGAVDGDRLRADGLQVHHLADRLSDQRRLVPQPQGGGAAGYRGERGAAGADAAMDDLPDDRGRHRVQGAGAGDSRSRHRRPSRRPAHRAVPRHQSPDLGILHRQLGAARRRLGRQAQRGRHVGHRVHE